MAQNRQQNTEILFLNRVYRKLLLLPTDTQNISGWENPPRSDATPEAGEQIIFTRFFFASRAMISVLASTNRFVVRIDKAHKVPLS